MLGVIPVAGLVAEGARTLREKEYAAFRELAGLDRADRERLLVSADRFTRESDATTLSDGRAPGAAARRFGIFGVRLATALIRGGAASSSELSDAMVKQSGLVELRQFVRTQFRTRATTLKVRGVLLGSRSSSARARATATDEIRAGIERISATAHTLRELTLLARARSEGLPLSDGGRRRCGADHRRSGTLGPVRLGLPEDADAGAVRERASRRSSRTGGASPSRR